MGEKIQDRLVVGQEAVVPGYGLGRITEITKDYIQVEPYVAGYPMKFDPKNIRPVKLIFMGV